MQISLNVNKIDSILRMFGRESYLADNRRQEVLWISHSEFVIR